MILAFAFILDLFFGDPHWLPHPICLIGNLISFLEKKYRKIMKNEFIAGSLLTITVLLLSFGVPFIILFIANSINIYFGFLIEVFFCYQIFATKSLKDESMKAYYVITSYSIHYTKLYDLSC